MSIKTILVPLSGVASSGGVLTAAMAVGKWLDAHIEVLHVAMDPRDSVAYVGEGMTSAMIEDVMSVAESEAGERQARAAEQFREACAKAGVKEADSAASAGGGFTAHLTTITGREEDAVAARGRLADLIVCCKPRQGDDVSPSVTLEAALMDTGRPVLVVPPGDPAPIGKTVALAWNGSPEAAKAIRFGLAFLHAADRVVVLEVEEAGKGGPDAAALIDYLAWHGIAASSQDVTAGAASIGDRLLGAAKAAEADMLIMGAYTRSRLRRLIFGGATREVLAGATIPVLMAH
ncbi:MAG TPA: universal stress protein [Alphaproteobacteria bacterium]|jgi:nucleotide-binding universal stress UspA family protein|nr:universal stress protein [Alphaproteobacteria bacterium]